LPELRFLRVTGNDVVEVVFDRIFVVAGSGFVDSLSDVENDACKTIYIKEGFLVVWNLSYGALCALTSWDVSMIDSSTHSPDIYEADR